MSDHGLLSGRWSCAINGGYLGPRELQGPLCGRSLDLHLSSTCLAQDSAFSCSAADQEQWQRGGEDLRGGRIGWRWEQLVQTQKERQKGQGGGGKRERWRFKVRWKLYSCPQPCCQVNAIWVFYRWGYSCWHFECTSYTLSFSPPRLLILYTVSHRLCEEQPRGWHYLNWYTFRNSNM